MHANIDVHSRTLISEFPGDGVNVFQKLNCIVQTRLLLNKVDTIGFSIKLHIKEGNEQLIKSIDSKIHRFYQFQL